MILNVLHVLGGLSTGGVETLLVNILKCIDNEQTHFDFVIHHPELNDYYELVTSRGSKIYICPDYKLYNHFQYKKWWKEFFKEHKEYNIVHGHATSTASIYLNIAKQYGIKTISHMHSDSYGSGFAAFIKKQNGKSIYKYADLLLGCSKEANEFLYGSKLSNSDKCVVLKNGIDIEKNAFNIKARSTIRSKYNIDEDTFVIGTIGRLTELKNPFFIIKIIKEITDLKKDLRFIWVGDGELKQEVEKEIVSLGLNNIFILVGSVQNPSDYLSSMDCFLFPSIKEGLGMALIEAQANGLECFVSNTISNEAVLTPLVHKISLEESPNDWANKINEYIGKKYNRDKYKDLVFNSGFDIKDVTKTVVELYGRLMQN